MQSFTLGIQSAQIYHTFGYVPKIPGHWLLKSNVCGNVYTFKYDDFIEISGVFIEIIGGCDS